MMTEILGLIAVLLGLGILVHQVVEAVVAPFYDNLVWLDPHKWTQIYFQFVVGVVTSFSLSLDVLPVMLAQFGVERAQTTVGVVLTGLLIGGGAELWHRVFDR